MPPYLERQSIFRVDVKDTHETNIRDYIGIHFLVRCFRAEKFLTAYELRKSAMDLNEIVLRLRGFRVSRRLRDVAYLLFFPERRNVFFVLCNGM